MLQCRNLEVILLPNRITSNSVPDNIYFQYTLRRTKFEIHIKYSEVEIISIVSAKETSCDAFWECFRYLFILQTLGTGYFFSIHDVRFSNFPHQNQKKALQRYAAKCLDKLASFYKTAPDWKDSSFLLALPKTLLNAEFLSKFVELYRTNNYRLIHNASLVQCSDSHINIEMRCAGIIQLFENLGYYSRYPNRTASAPFGKWCLKKGLKYIFSENMLDQLFYDIPDTEVFIDKLCNTRHRIAHYDNRKQVETYLSGEECAKYARILMIYYRYVMLKKIGLDVSEFANKQIELWKKVTVKSNGEVK